MIFDNDLILSFVAIFFATIGFSVVFNVPSSELFFCGVVGLLCYTIYIFVTRTYEAEIFGCILGTFIATCLSRTFTFYRKMPLTVYIIPAIIPLAPGGAIYNSMYHIINEDLVTSLSYGLYAVKIAGSIGIGISICLSLPTSFFHFKKTTN